MTIEDLAKGTAQQIVESLKNDAKEMWQQIPDQAKEGLQTTALRAAKLMHRRMSGENVDEEWLQVQAQTLNWQFVGAAMASQAFWQSVDRIVGVVSTGLGVMAKAAINGIKG